jgi:ketosteroid isomerase-like protein
MSQENVDIVRRAYVALNERDLDGLAKLNHPDAILDFSRSIGPQRGIYRGSQEFLDAVSAFLDAFQMYELTPLDFDVGPGGQIVVRHRVRARGQGSGLEWENEPDAAFVFEVRGGKVVRTTLYQHRREALEAVGLSE